MKINKKSILLTIICIMLVSTVIWAQKSSNSEKSIIQKAMKDELERNYSRLKLDNLASPFFIGYTMKVGKSLEVKSVLGSTLSADEYPIRSFNVKVLVGDYQMNDENFMDMNQLYSSGNYVPSSIPIEEDYNGIRRAFWLTTDNVYKKAAEKLERKKAAMKQQTVASEYATLEDFSKIKPVVQIEPGRIIPFDKAHWENIANDISKILKDYPEVYASEARIVIFTGEKYYLTSEGTEIIEPDNYASIYINAYTQTTTGEELTDNVIYHASNPEDLPSKELIARDVKTLGEKLSELRKAKILAESYNGPVMFEGSAAAEFFAQRFFRTGNGLLASRKPIVGDARIASYINQQYGEPLDSYIDKRIISKNVTIKAVPSLNKFNNIPLIGSYSVDEEGVIPPNEIILVQNGILKSLLNNRTPAPKIKNSNGHQRGFWETGLTTCTGASVINIVAENGLSDAEMKAKLIQMAKDEGLEYGIIIRKIKPLLSGKYPRFNVAPQSYGGGQPKAFEDPVYIYRVYVTDGREELLRCAEMQNVSISALKHIAAFSNKQIVHNTLMPQLGSYGDYGGSGYPASFITPSAFILEELEVKNAKQDYTPKPPIVESPLRK